MGILVTFHCLMLVQIYSTCLQLLMGLTGIFCSLWTFGVLSFDKYSTVLHWLLQNSQRDDFFFVWNCFLVPKEQPNPNPHGKWVVETVYPLSEEVLWKDKLQNKPSCEGIRWAVFSHSSTLKVTKVVSLCNNVNKGFRVQYLHSIWHGFES